MAPTEKKTKKKRKASKKEDARMDKKRAFGPSHNSFVASASDFWWDPNRGMSFGGSVANIGDKSKEEENEGKEKKKRVKEVVALEEGSDSSK